MCRWENCPQWWRIGFLGSISTTLQMVFSRKIFATPGKENILCSSLALFIYSLTSLKYSIKPMSDSKGKEKKNFWPSIKTLCCGILFANASLKAKIFLLYKRSKSVPFGCVRWGYFNLISTLNSKMSTNNRRGGLTLFCPAVLVWKGRVLNRHLPYPGPSCLSTQHTAKSCPWGSVGAPCHFRAVWAEKLPWKNNLHSK